MLRASKGALYAEAIPPICPCPTMDYVRSRQDPLIIFDIDDTLVDTNFRSLEALHRVGAELDLLPLLQLEYPQVDKSCGVTCKTAGLTDAKTKEVCGGKDSRFYESLGKAPSGRPGFCKIRRGDAGGA